MKFIYFSLIFVAFSLSAFADEPPSYIPFNIPSIDKSHFAKIYQKKQDWYISVYETKDSVFLWQTSYNYDGYASGSLTNNGKYFVYVNDWLCFEHKNQIRIYSKDISRFYSGKELSLDSASFPHTTSHQIWIKDFIINDTNISINTLNGKKLEIELNGLSYKIEKIQHNEKELEQLRDLKQLTIFIVGCIGLFIVGLSISKILVIKKRKEKP